MPKAIRKLSCLLPAAAGLLCVALVRAAALEPAPPGPVPDVAARLVSFYAERGGTPLWTRAQVRLPLALLLVADRHGLDPEAYGASRWLHELPADGSNWTGETDREFTTALLRYAGDLAAGRVDPATVDEEWHLERPPVDPLALLDGEPTGAEITARLAALAPTQPLYAGLQQALAHYRELASGGGWPLLGDGPWLREGERHPDVQRLRARLAAESPLDPVDDPERFDPGLATALRDFQARHGLKVDAVVGPRTRAALNVTAAERVAQLRANLERWRWLPRDLGTTHLLVNSAGFELTLVRDGEPVLHSKTIAGRPSRASPSLASRITHVVFNPDWTIPYRIATLDLLPKQQADPGYLAERAIRVLDRRDGRLDEVDPASVDWAALNRRNFPYLLRQDPGPGNSLGRLKFHMPNRHSIYLHDTPEKQLFNEPSRAFSSGCIRVEASTRLAELLFAEKRWDAAAIAARIDAGDTRYVKLPEAVPLYLVYLTAWRADDGSYQFRPDIYGLDAPLIGALDGPADNAGTPERLAAGDR